jgi:hypothetical protein
MKVNKEYILEMMSFDEIVQKGKDAVNDKISEIKTEWNKPYVDETRPVMYRQSNGDGTYEDIPADQYLND